MWMPVVEDKGVSSGRKRVDTYKKPQEKIPEMPSLREREMFRCQIRHSGTKNIAMSESALNTEEAIYVAFMFKHLPGKSWFQIFCRGLQRKIEMKRKMT